MTKPHSLPAASNRGGPHPLAVTSPLPASPKARRLTRRRVRALVRIGQWWIAPDGREWKVIQVWRKDEKVQLQRPAGREIRTVKFSELATFSPAGLST